MKTKTALMALSALAQDNRLAVFRLLVEHAPAGLPAGTIAQRLGMSPATLPFHRKERTHARLVAARLQGIAWEGYHTLGDVRYFGGDEALAATSGCWTPAGEEVGTRAAGVSMPKAKGDAPSPGCPPAAAPVTIYCRSRP